MPGVHAKFSPSGAERWMNCPGSIVGSIGVEDRSSPFAAEGTLAHDLAERAISGEDIGRFMGEDMEVDGHQITVTDDMLDYIQVFVDYAKEAIEKSKVHGVEDRVYVRAVSDDLNGTADLWALFEGDTAVLEVTDLKFGRGVMVSPKENPQLMIYGLGALEHLVEAGVVKQLSKIDFVRLTIVQPRAPNGDTIKSWTVSVEDLLAWRDEELAPAVKVANALDAPRSAGSWCRWCPAKARCPEIAKHANEVARAEFSDDNKVTLPAPDAMEMETIVRVLENRDLFMSWLSEVEGHALSLLQGGTEIPGYKVVAGRTQRKWIDQVAAEERLRKSFKVGQITEQSLLPFTKIEKISKLGKKLVDELTTKPEGAPTIAPADDKRPALLPAVAEFDAIESDDIEDLL